jgi:hypothetical protein
MPLRLVRRPAAQLARSRLEVVLLRLNPDESRGGRSQPFGSSSEGMGLLWGLLLLAGVEAVFMLVMIPVVTRNWRAPPASEDEWVLPGRGWPGAIFLSVFLLYHWPMLLAGLLLHLPTNPVWERWYRQLYLPLYLVGMVSTAALYATLLLLFRG